MTKTEEYLIYIKAPKLSEHFYVLPFVIEEVPSARITNDWDSMQYHLAPQLELIRIVTWHSQAPELTNQIELVHFDCPPTETLPKLKELYSQAQIDAKIASHDSRNSYV